MRTTTVAIAMFITTIACNKPQEKKTEPPAKPPTAEPTAPVEPAPALAEHMKEHFNRVRAIRDAVVVGDYAATREPATWLAEHGAPKNIPDPWIPKVTDFRVMAGGLGDAKDVAAVALALGPVARSCGGCHEELEATIKYELPAAPTGEGFAAEMARHKWAADLLWDGVVVPSPEAWTAGAKHFAETTLTPETSPTDKEKARALVNLAARAQTLGTKAGAAADLLSRGVVYGELLATCATCHDLAGKSK